MFAINQTKKISKNTVLFELNTGQKFVIGYSYSSMEKTDLGGGAFIWVYQLYCKPA